MEAGGVERECMGRCARPHWFAHASASCIHTHTYHPREEPIGTEQLRIVGRVRALFATRQSVPITHTHTHTHTHTRTHTHTHTHARTHNTHTTHTTHTCNSHAHDVSQQGMRRKAMSDGTMSRRTIQWASVVDGRSRHQYVDIRVHGGTQGMRTDS